jgi:hypothetical protein
MLRVMYSAILVAIATLGAVQAASNQIEFGENSILIYVHENQPGETQFVLRIARFLPDIVMEWESLSHQGTIHLRKKAVEKGKGLTLSGLFDPGVDSDSKDVMTTWLSKALYDELLKAGQTKIKLNRLSTKFTLKGEITYSLNVDKREITVPAIVVADARGGKWVFQNARENPVLLEFSNEYYREYLKSVTVSQPGSLRWIRELPPIK